MDRCGRRAGFHRSLDRGDIFVGRSLDPGAVQAEHGLHGYGRAGGMVLICFGQMAHVDTSTNAASIFNKRRNTEQERLAQYFTPPQVADFLADLLNIKLDEMVIDPACGEADLLLAANRQVRQNHGTAADIYGIDISHEVVEVARERLTEVGFPPERIAEGDTPRGKMVPCMPTDGNSGHDFTLVSIDTMVLLAAFLRGRIIFVCQN